MWVGKEVSGNSMGIGIERLGFKCQLSLLPLKPNFFNYEVKVMISISWDQYKD